MSPQTGRTMEVFDDNVRVRAGDMLYSWSGNPDTSLDVFVWDGEDGWLNQHVFKVTPASGVRTRFLFFLLKWIRPVLAEIARNKQTSGLGHITIGDMKAIMVALPDEDEQDALLEVLNPLQDKIELHVSEGRTLTALRDLLIPRLLSGSLRLNDAVFDLSASV